MALARLLILAIAIGPATIACTASGGAGSSAGPSGSADTSPSAAPSASVRPGASFVPRPTVGPTVAPVTGEVPETVLTAIRADLTTQTGVDASDAVIVKAEAVDWPDGSMGCPQPGIMYIQQVIPGYQVVLSLDGKTYDYRVAASTGEFRLCEGLKPPSAS
jgi:hypothetical protein